MVHNELSEVPVENLPVSAREGSCASARSSLLQEHLQRHSDGSHGINSHFLDVGVNTHDFFDAGKGEHYPAATLGCRCARISISISISIGFICGVSFNSV
jgi:hypothetical protein